MSAEPTPPIEPASTEWVDAMPGTWFAFYRPMRLPPVWPVIFPTALLDIYEDRLVFRTRSQLKRFFPFAVVPLASIGSVKRSSLVPRVVTITHDPALASKPRLFRGDTVDFTHEWLDDPQRSAGVAHKIVLDSRSARIDWLVGFFESHGISVGR